MKRLLLLAIPTLTGLGAYPEPQCDGYTVWGHSEGYVVFAPRITGRTANTTVDVYAYNPSGAPTSEIGWSLLAEGVTQRDAVLWWPQTEPNVFTPGAHAVAMVVHERGILVDDWLRSPRCLILTLPEE